MANILNAIIASQGLNNPSNGVKKPVFTIDTKGKVKPKEDKAKLLPSRIFGSPIEYVKDLKQDIVNIGRAAKGKANDHELGRINDLAMKMGSLGLAAYLCAKNPLKMSKTMEFVGFSTFFASMALWPKLAIQAPLKARTGVDIHQKYIDSQGRKKMLYQDPQYVLTDLYSKEDLEKMGDKLKVSKNLPDRDNFIKQRAQKTALQGNTLWMMTAGFATPLMSALMCNRLEKPVNYLLEKISLKATDSALQNNGIYQGTIDKLKQRIAASRFEKFISQNMDKPLNSDMISQLSEKIAGKANSAMFKDAISKHLSGLKTSGQHTTIDKELSDTLRNLFNVTYKFTGQKNVLDRFISERIGEKSGSYIANQWDRVGNGFMKALRLKGKDLKALSEGNLDVLNEKLTALSSSSDYETVIKKLMKLVNQFEETTGDKNFIQRVARDAKRICSGLSDDLLTMPEFAGVSEIVTSEAKKGTLENTINLFAKEKVQGAGSSLYRLIQTLDVYKRVQDGSLKTQLEELIKNSGKEADSAVVDKLVKACKDIMLKATTTDHIEKLTTQGFNLSKDEYKIVMEALFGDKAGETVKTALNAASDSSSITGFKKYISSFRQNVINWKNEMTSDLSRRTLDSVDNASKLSNSAERNNLVGKSIKDYIKDFAQQKSNSLKWLKIFGISMAVLTAVTLTAGLLIGRKGKIEKQAEEENKVNG